MSNILWIGNTNILELADLRSNVEGELIEDATVTATLRTMAGQEVSGQSWPVTLDHVEGGLYRATLSHEIEASHGSAYVAHIEADAGLNRQGQWEARVMARRRS